MRLFIHCLYFICERKFYARTHGKITRQWKSSLTLITIVSALTSIIFCVNIIRYPKWFSTMESNTDHKNTFSRKQRYLTETFINVPVSPASLYLTSLVPVPHVPASRTWCPQVPRLASLSSHTSVPIPPSPCPHPSFIHSPKVVCS